VDVGIVGLPNVGKSTLFNALTNAGVDAANYPFCTVEPNTGIVPVPDSRLDILNGYHKRPEAHPAVLKVVDIAGLVRGASKGEGLGNRFLAHIREVDAILHIVRCFEDDDVAHVDGSLDAIRDIETVETELLIADLATAETALEKARAKAKRSDKEAAARVKVLEPCMEALSEGRPVRTVEFADADDRRELKGLGLLTAKRVLYVANVGEDAQSGDTPMAQAVAQYANSHGGKVVYVSAEIESELAELEPEDRAEMLADMGLEQSALQAVAKAGYELLGLHSFFTVGDKEVRAWTVPVGATAPQAAGVIHTDFEKGFIRAEVYRVGDLQTYGSEAGIRAAGKLGMQGKEYIVQDGDVCFFHFSS